MTCLFVVTDIKKIQVSAQDHFKRIFNDHQKLKLQLESQKKELESRIEQMEKRAVDNESESRKLAEELEKVCYFVLHWCTFVFDLNIINHLTIYGCRLGDLSKGYRTQACC